jgi:hypothetical protein
LNPSRQTEDIFAEENGYGRGFILKEQLEWYWKAKLKKVGL